MKYKSSYQSAFIDVSVHTCILSSAFYLLWYFNSSFMSVLTIPFLGMLLHRNYVMFHDCCHNSYTPNKTLNQVIATIYGITTFTSTNWILDHHTHHLTNGNIENKYNFKFNELLYWNKKQYCQFNVIARSVFKFFHTPVVFFTFFPVLYFFVIQRFIYIMKKNKYKGKIGETMRNICSNHLINNIGSGVLCYVMYRNDILVHFLVVF